MQTSGLSEQLGSQMLPRWEQSMHGPSLTDDAPIAHRTTPWELERHVCLRLLGLNSTYRLPADNPSQGNSQAGILVCLELTHIKDINRRELQRNA